MPPPKKPKTGPTSLEQFLTDEERTAIHRTHSHSDGNSSPSWHEGDVSDSDVFENGKASSSASDSDSEKRNSPMLKTVFQKSVSLDEQKVPGSPDDVPTTPSDGISDISFSGDRAMKQKLEKDTVMSQRKGLQAVAYDRKEGESKQTVLKGDTGKLLDSLVAKAMANNIAHIRSQEHTVNSLPQFVNPHPMSVVPTSNSAYDCEPHDLSKRSEKGKLLSPRMYDNVMNMMDNKVIRQYQDWMFGGQQDVMSQNNNSKHFMDSHKRIVGLLSEGSSSLNGRDFKTAPVLEKENIVRPVPQMNGFFQHLDLHGVRDLSRMEQFHRESMDRTVAKSEERGEVLHQNDRYLPVHSMMPPSGGIGQSPTSTTIDLSDVGDLYHHPGLLDPHIAMRTEVRRMKHDASGSAMNKLCQVCSDNASGFHYGVWSCEGCKAFFKRSIQGPVDYVCPATNSCTIDKHRRKSCQACRLRKCYEVGMNKGSQRKERKSGQNIQKGQKRPRLDSAEGTVNSTSGLMASSAKNPRKSQTSVLLDALHRADLPNLESHHDHSLPPTRVHLLNSLVKLAERELVYLINWAKKVPGYTELSLGDQVHLIECCWMELLLLNCAFRSMEHRGRQLVFAPDLILERPFWSVVGMESCFEQVAAVSDQMVQYNLHKEEVLFLQATVLANAEVRKLASFGKIREIQQSVLDGLVDVAQKYHPDNLRHIPSILLLLTHIKLAAHQAISHFQDLKKEGIVYFCDLLTEMLDSQSVDEQKPSVP